MWPPLAHTKKATSNLVPGEGEGQRIASCALVSLWSPGSLTALSFLGPMMSFEAILPVPPKNQGSWEVYIYFNCDRLLQKCYVPGGKKEAYVLLFSLSFCFSSWPWLLGFISLNCGKIYLKKWKTCTCFSQSFCMHRSGVCEHTQLNLSEAVITGRVCQLLNCLPI